MVSCFHGLLSAQQIIPAKTSSADVLFHHLHPVRGRPIFLLPPRRVQEISSLAGTSVDILCTCPRQRRRRSRMTSSRFCYCVLSSQTFHCRSCLFTRCVEFLSHLWCYFKLLFSDWLILTKNRRAHQHYRWPTIHIMATGTMWSYKSGSAPTYLQQEMKTDYSTYSILLSVLYRICSSHTTRQYGKLSTFT